MILVTVRPDPFSSGARTLIAAHEQGIKASDIAPLDWASGWAVFRNGEPSSMEADLCDGDRVTFAAVPQGETLAYVFLLLLSTGLSMALAPKPPNLSRRDASSATYGWDGVQPNRGEGQPVPLYQGKLRAGGQIISEFVESRGNGGSYYNALIAYGYGPVKSIAGITADTAPDAPLRSGGASGFGIPDGLWINDTAAKEYDGVELHVRLGSSEQLAVPGFNFVTSVVTVDQALEQGAATSGTDPEFAVSQTSPGPGEDSVWSAYGISTTHIDSTYDWFTAKLQFPQGLYSNYTDGSIGPWSTSISVRYREVDGSGTPVTTGGFWSNGWVYLRPTPLLRMTATSTASIDFRFPLYDPQTYQPPQLGGVATLGIGSTLLNMYLGRAGGIAFPSSWTPSAACPELSFETWFVLKPNGPSAGSTTNVDDTKNTKDNPVIDLLDTATKRGIRVALCTRTFQLSPGNNRTRIVPVVSIGDGSTIKTYYERNTSGASSTTAAEIGDVSYRATVEIATATTMEARTHIAVTYQQDISGTLDRLRVYADSDVILEVIADIGLQMPASATPLYIGRQATITDQQVFQGFLDEWILWSRELQQSEIEASFNSGLGTTHTVDTRMVAAYHFDDSPAVQGDGATTPDFSGNSNTLTLHLASGSTSNMACGLVSSFMDKLQPTNTIKVSRYRIEIMRALRDVQSVQRVDDTRLQEIQLLLDRAFTYPTQPLIGVRVRATDSLNGSRPNVTSLIEGRLPPVWDGASAEDPQFVEQWSRSPAWNLLGRIISSEYGLGQFFRPADAAVADFDDFADYCAELVYDGVLSGRVEISDVTGPIQNLIYTSGGLGSIAVAFEPGTDPPSHLKVGDAIGFHGAPDPATYPTHVFQDVNVPTVRGFTITQVLTSAENGGAGGIIRVQYQPDATAPYADPPWGGSGDLQLAIQPAHLTGTMEGREPRHLMDIAVDKPEDAWESLQTAAYTARARLVLDTRRVRLVIDRPRAPVDIIGQATIVADSFEMEYSSGATSPNAYDVTFWDEDLNYEQSTVPVEHASVAGQTDLSLVRRESITLYGVTRRSQAKREALYRLNLLQDVHRRGSFVSSIDALPIQAGDVVQIAHTIVPRGTSCRVYTAADTSTVQVDRPVTLEAATTYKLAVRSGTGTFEVRTVTNSAGTYDGTVGDALTVSAPFSVQAAKYDHAIICKDGDELLAQITSISLTQDLRRSIQWQEYVPSVYEVEEYGDFPDDPEEVSALAAFESSTSAPPAPVTALAVSESFARAAGGGSVRTLTLSWLPDEGSARQVAGHKILLSVDSGPWELLGTAGASARGFSAPVPRLPPGARVSVCVQPASAQGLSRPPERSARRALVLRALGPAPAAPEGLSATIAGDVAEYRVAPSEGRSGASHELRRGGWIVGQPVVTLPAGADTASSRDWAFAVASSIGPTDTELVCRAVAPDGAASDALVTRWQPVLTNSVSLDDVGSALAETSWEDFEDGWTDTTIPIASPNTTLSGVEVGSCGELTLSAGYLTGTFTTTDPSALLDPTLRIYRNEIVQVSAYCEATQVHPLVFDEANFSWSDADQMSWEGPVSPIGDDEDPGQCSITIEVRYLLGDGTFTAWTRYRPNVVACVGAQFRLNCTRPSEDFNVQVRRFSTILTRMPQHKNLRTPFQAMLQNRSLRRA